ncbi:hypothetical protein PR202_gb01673 [Eleusine coracana subsp. coracana]|uniref:F-box domain-containing protein n=1 Tax=Eleusine coracana subsp. coracana TaxID=191504 RepID=A0AAV5DX97_ELECO|nr:hypothetical protein PR202_gb01673 [Eleusine coracana subsp. coracana]
MGAGGMSERVPSTLHLSGSGGGEAGGCSTASNGAAAEQWEGDGGGNAAARARGVNAGIMDEQVLALVFRALNWDPKSLCVVARVSRRLRAVAERYFVCVSGHLHGSCWLARLSDSEGADGDGDDASSGASDEDDDGEP